MRRLLKYLAWAVGLLIAIPVLLITVVVLAVNTDTGRGLVEAIVPRVTGDTVKLEGLRGRFPDRMRLRRLTVADPGGVWLTMNGAALDWSPWRLIEGDVVIDRLEAESLAIDRLPAASAEKQESSGGGGVPALHGVLSRLHIGRVDIGSSVAGQPIVLAVDGAGQFAALDDGEAHLAITALQSRENEPLDHYLVELSMVPAHLHATISVAEGAHGLISGLAQMPNLGAIAVAGTADGPLNALSTKVTIGAGLLRGDLNGSVDLTGHKADVAFSVVAPAMSPGPGVGWALVRLEGKVDGPFTAPQATATLVADDLTAAGATIGAIRATINGGATGKTELHASLDGVHVPGPSPDIFASGPLTVDAAAALADANRPVQFSLKHPLFTATGTADVTQGHIHLLVPDLGPFAGIGGVDLQGRTELDLGATRTGDVINLTLTGGVGIAGGMPPVPALVGQSASIDLAAAMHGENVTLSRFVVKGAYFTVGVTGTFLDRVLSTDWTLALDDLSVIRPDLAGTIAARGHAGGALDSLSLSSDLTGNLAAKGQRLEQVNAHVALDGLPDKPTGRLTADGTLFEAPLNVALNAQQQDGNIHVVIDRTSWKSLNAAGTLDLAKGGVLPTGKITLSMRNLADLAPLIGQPIAGDVSASLDSSPDVTRIKVLVSNGAVSTAGAVTKADLDAAITDPTGHPVVDAALTLDGIAAGGVRGAARMTAKGPLDGLQLTLAANTGALAGMPAKLDTSATLNLTGQTLSLASLQGAWGKETIRLLAPAKLAFADGITIDRLNLGFRQGGLVVAGRWGGQPSGGGTALTVNLTNLPVDVFAALAPEYAADGTIAGEARLTGTPARPEGTIHIRASGVRLRTGNGRALPAAASTVDVTLGGANARVNAGLTAGPSNITAAGVLPLIAIGSMDVRIGGTVDLAMLNPLLAAQGRNVRGRLDLNLEVTGAPNAPRPGGTVRLANGDVQDSSLGAHISAIVAALRFDGETVHLDQFQGRAGQGTISGTGSVGLTGTQAVDLSVRANNARLLSSDMITSAADANLTVRGALQGDLTLAGSVLARVTNIQIPEKLPASIAVFPVRNAGTPPPKPPPPSTAPNISLNLTLDAPNQVYIRGRGLDAELGGRVVFTGTATAPSPQGAIHLRRGTFSLAGQTLNLSEGTIDFAGGPLTNPSLKFVATAGNANLTSTLTISGYVKDPKIALSSVPDMPQDEILSQLLFNTAKSRLNPFQIAQIAAALASISGVGPSVGDPLSGVRSALGLDQLSVGSNSTGGAALQAGRYVAPGVRIGATQSATGSGTQATVQIDLAKGLKLETTVGSGSASATPGVGGTSNGTGVGLTYQFEY